MGAAPKAYAVYHSLTIFYLPLALILAAHAVLASFFARSSLVLKYTLTPDATQSLKEFPPSTVFASAPKRALLAKPTRPSHPVQFMSEIHLAPCKVEATRSETSVALSSKVGCLFQLSSRPHAEMCRVIGGAEIDA